jgi:hypothetical protein
MIRNIAIVVLCLITTSIYSQRTFDYDFYLNGTIGFGIPLNNIDGSFNNLNMDYSGLFFDKGSAFIKVKDNFGLHMNVIGIGYWYAITEESIKADNPNYYLWDKENYYGNVKLSILAGLAYKFKYKRLIFIPYFDLGFIPLANSSVDSYKLKQQNSNNIRQIGNSSKFKYDRFDYTFGADLYFHFGKHWGFATTIQYDRFSASTDFTTTTKDYYSIESTKVDNMKFDHKNILVSFGLFISFYDNNKTENQ